MQTHNIHTLPTVGQPDLAAALQHAIIHDCHRQVDNRLAPKLARALLHPSDADIFYVRQLIGVLRERIDYKAQMAFNRL